MVTMSLSVASATERTCWAQHRAGNAGSTTCGEATEAGSSLLFPATEHAYCGRLQPESPCMNPQSLNITIATISFGVLRLILLNPIGFRVYRLSLK